MASLHRGRQELQEPLFDHPAVDVGTDPPVKGRFSWNTEGALAHDLSFAASYFLTLRNGPSWKRSWITLDDCENCEDRNSSCQHIFTLGTTISISYITIHSHKKGYLYKKKIQIYAPRRPFLTPPEVCFRAAFFCRSLSACRKKKRKSAHRPEKK